MRRRTFLTLFGAGTVPLAGCIDGTAGTGDRTDTGATDSPTDTTETVDGTGTADETPTATDAPTTDEGSERTPLPDECPTSQDFGVEWPENLDAATVESFVEAYEHAYYREVVVEYEPESSLDSYGLDGTVTNPPREAGDGWVVAYSGNGGVYRPTLFLDATTSDPPEGAEPVPASEVDDETLTDLLEEAAETGEAEHHVEPPGETVDRYVDRLASLSDGFELSGPGDSDSLYVDVDGTVVELSATATNFHGDYWWDARYYVTERVVRRTNDEDTDPREGTLLECRRLD